MADLKKISQDIEKYVGGRENISGVAHCATRLRIVLKDNSLADLKNLKMSTQLKEHLSLEIKFS